MMRSSIIKRKTGETDISLSLNLDGRGQSDINTGCGFLDHMLTLFAKHGRFDLDLTCSGDTEVDYHHTAEDIGICLGLAFAKAIGDKKGIVRYEFFIAFVRSFPIALHIRQPEGRNSHHIAEGAFKSVARSLREAVAIEPEYADEIPSTKGML